MSLVLLHKYCECGGLGGLLCKSCHCSIVMALYSAQVFPPIANVEPGGKFYCKSQIDG